ncbi:MAG: helix-turn-helix domain-containing protein [Candidatus Omnitrophica bacterium]|nr:helix-turn-helix domain-containing protein [Candidatus Omnitrophota bacterium]
MISAKRSAMKEKLLTTREASQQLKLSEKELIDLARTGLIPHFKLGGEFLRFKQQDIVRIRREIKKYNLPHRKVQRWERIKEFLYFHDFYLIASALIIGLLWILIRDFS